jgi:cytochrome bd-type quinol oxidase subunit 2
MITKASSYPDDRPVLRLLSVGTVVATLTLAAGMLAALIVPGHPFFGHILNLTGVAMFVLLPVARVIAMLILFLRRRDHALSAAALAVLLIITLGSVTAMLLVH